MFSNHLPTFFKKKKGLGILLKTSYFSALFCVRTMTGGLLLAVLVWIGCGALHQTRVVSIIEKAVYEVAVIFTVT